MKKEQGDLLPLWSSPHDNQKCSFQPPEVFSHKIVPALVCALRWWARTLTMLDHTISPPGTGQVVCVCVRETYYLFLSFASDPDGVHSHHFELCRLPTDTSWYLFVTNQVPISPFYPPSPPSSAIRGCQCAHFTSLQNPFQNFWGLLVSCAVIGYFWLQTVKQVEDDGRWLLFHVHLFDKNIGVMNDISVPEKMHWSFSLNLALKQWCDEENVFCSFVWGWTRKCSCFSAGETGQRIDVADFKKRRKEI